MSFFIAPLVERERERCVTVCVYLYVHTYQPCLESLNLCRSLILLARPLASCHSLQDCDCLAVMIWGDWEKELVGDAVRIFTWVHA